MDPKLESVERTALPEKGQQREKDLSEAGKRQA